MRRFAWLCVAVGVLGATAVWVWADLAINAFADSSDYAVWQMLTPADRASGWVPAKLWPAVIGGACLAAFRVLLLAIRRPESSHAGRDG